MWTKLYGKRINRYLVRLSILSALAKKTNHDGGKFLTHHVCIPIVLRCNPKFVQDSFQKVTSDTNFT